MVVRIPDTIGRRRKDVSKVTHLIECEAVAKSLRKIRNSLTLGWQRETAAYLVMVMRWACVPA